MSGSQCFPIHEFKEVSFSNFVAYALAVGAYGLLTFLVLFFAMRQRPKPEVQEDLGPIAVRGADAVPAALRQKS